METIKDWYKSDRPIVNCINTELDEKLLKGTGIFKSPWESSSLHFNCSNELAKILNENSNISIDFGKILKIQCEKEREKRERLAQEDN